MPQSIGTLAFYVLAPSAQIDLGIFNNQLDKTGILEKVKARVAAYEGTCDTWFQQWFQPTLETIDIRPIAWEGLVEIAGPEFEDFYGKCLHYNGKGS